MERTLIRTGFLDADHPKGIMRALRRLFGSQMDEREVQILHGIWSKTDHHLRNREKPLNKGGGEHVREMGEIDFMDDAGEL